MKMINKIKLFSNDNQKSKEIELKLREELEKNAFLICEDDYELGIAIGGDGSFLRMLKQCNFNSDIYYIGVNTGTLGFLQEIKPEQLKEFVQKLKENNFKIEEIGIQETKVETTESTSIFYSLNDIVIRDKELNTTIINIKIDDIELEKFVGDGILVSTSVGSTAYNLSYGGSIVYNTLHTLQITPIAPLNSKVYRNLLNGVVIPEDKLITFIPDKEKRNILITIDGENNIYEDVYKIDTIVSKKRIKCLRMNDYNFINIINEKFLK
jgi:NAD+ kinase